MQIPEEETRIPWFLSQQWTSPSRAKQNQWNQ